MALSKEQEERMYDDTIATKTIVEGMEKRLEKGDRRLDECDERVSKLESEHSLLKGRLGAFILGVTFVVSLLVNGILWLWSHLGSRS